MLLNFLISAVNSVFVGLTLIFHLPLQSSSISKQWERVNLVAWVQMQNECVQMTVSAYNPSFMQRNLEMSAVQMFIFRLCYISCYCYLKIKNFLYLKFFRVFIFSIRKLALKTIIFQFFPDHRVSSVTYRKPINEKSNYGHVY